MIRFQHLRRYFAVAAVAAAFVAQPLALHVTSGGLSIEAAVAHAKKGGGKGGGGNGKGNAGKSGTGKGKGKARASKPAAPLVIRHRNGIRESVRGGRYEMRDAQGRRIVNRPATGADYERLRRN
ncbi:hypothetical protein [Mesorhizobium sp. J428]|uniref:hypothetical protein n=1 Tax=Mesorhizobium sp. J428 TaxID=2898440 RepID=UPI002150B06D|nr:hypothetical protein [Mesorhizobium sp. J428]MCR5857996.1 hypothetical protein [Mesorhizobium sp. J428]